MTTILTATNSDATKRRCDARCHHAMGQTCGCICGGVFHGVAPSLITKDLWAQFWAHMSKSHGGTLVNLKPIQLTLTPIPKRRSLDG